MVTRTYFEKNNTLIRNSNINTGRNPITELHYGGSVYNLDYTRFIFKFDETKLRGLYNDGVYPDINKMKHILRMTNTSCFDIELLNQDTIQGKGRTSSFDLIIFPLTQDWDEGTGYDYISCTYLNGEESFSDRPSNWVWARYGNFWSMGDGGYSGNTNDVEIVRQHFDRGNENIEMDITTHVNNIITGDTNYGFCLAFSDEIEKSPSEKLQYVGFFTRHTETFYEPHIETIYNEHINDSRDNFFVNKNNKLYLYVNDGGLPINLDNTPTVVVRDNNGDIFLSGNTEHVTLGVYSFNIVVPRNADYPDCTMFTDTWSNLMINGVQQPDVELEFVVKNGGINIGNTEEIPKEYGFSVHGVKRDEKINRGDTRKIIIKAKIPYTINQQDIIDKLEYRLYVKEGTNEYTVVDYQPIHKTFDQNYFLLDTDSLIPNKYWLDIKLVTNREVRTIKDIVAFHIVGLVEKRGKK